MSFKDAFIERWNAKSPEDQEYLKKALGLSIGQIGAYFLYRKAGAPKWAAWGIAAASANASFAPYKFAYEQRQLELRKLIAAAKQMDQELREEVERERIRRHRAQNQ